MTRFFARAAALLAAPFAATAQTDYPNRPVKIIVPFAPGGSTDVVARILADRLGNELKQSFVVENKPGAGGNIGADAVAKAPADGYTVLVGVTSLIQTPHLMGKLPYDIFKDLSPVVMLARGANIFVVPANSPANTLQEFVAMVKANPGKHNYGSYGNGTTAHIFGDSFNRQAGMDLVHAPFRSSSQMIAAIVGGQLSAGFPDAASALPQIMGGKLKALAVTGTQRYKNIPNVPTFAEAGFKGFEPYGWYGVFVPAGTPKPAVDKLSNEIARIVRTPEVAARFEDLGLIVTAAGPDAFAADMKNDSQVWGRAIRAGNIRAD